MTGIYKIESIVNPERIYIGSAVRIDYRWWTHLSDLRLNKHHSKKLQRHFNKYGKADLKFTVITSCEKCELIEKEQFFIDIYNPYFNGHKIAGSPLGSHHTEESKEKIRIANIGNKHGLGYKHTVEQIRKQSEAAKGRIPWNKGLKTPDEVKRKISESEKGKKMSEEAKQKISNALKGRACQHSFGNKYRLGKKNPHSKDWCNKVSLIMKGHPVSEETKIKIGLANKGKSSLKKGQKLSEEHRLHIKESWILRKLKQSA